MYGYTSCRVYVTYGYARRLEPLNGCRIDACLRLVRCRGFDTLTRAQCDNIAARMVPNRQRAVESELLAALSSEFFCKSKKCQVFLEHLVKTALLGHTDRLKE